MSLSSAVRNREGTVILWGQMTILRVVLSICAALLTGSSHAALLAYDEFDSFSTGELDGSGNWSKLFVEAMTLEVAEDSAMTYAGYDGGGGKYVEFVTGGSSNAQRYTRSTSPLTANTSQTYYVSFLVRLESAGSDENAHILSLGNRLDSALYEFLRIHARTSDEGFNLGLSRGPNVGLGADSAGGIRWGSSVLNLNQTYLVVARYTHVYGGGTSADSLHLWINPPFTTPPTTASSEVAILPGELGIDILYDGDTVENIYLNFRSSNAPDGTVDGLRYAHAETPEAAWDDLGPNTTVPVVLSGFALE